MDFQKITSTGTAIAVVGTGAVVGGNQALDHYKGGPQKREDAKVEMIREVVREEVYLQLVNALPKSSGPVKGLSKPNLGDYKNQIPNK